MSITVVGSVAYDSIETPAGRRERCLGGAATYFSLLRQLSSPGSARHRGRRRRLRPLNRKPSLPARNIDISALSTRPEKSFFWEGSYLENINEAKTHNTELNVFAAFEPKFPRLTQTPIPLSR